ncbi:hypothetical protein [Nocardia asteroides]
MTPVRELRLPHGFDAVDDIVSPDAVCCAMIAFGTDSTMVLTPPLPTPGAKPASTP